MCEVEDGVLPVQVSANVVLVPSKTSVIVCEAEPCSHLETKDKTKKKTQLPQ